MDTTGVKAGIQGRRVVARPESMGDGRIKD